MDEEAFLRKLLENPADDVVRLVYADWLEERDTDEARRKAEFLRIQSALGNKTGARRKVRQLWDKRAELAAELPAGWLAVVSRLAIENCQAAGNRISRLRLPVRFEYKCPKQWADLKPLEDQSTRFCQACEQTVYYCDSIRLARQHAAEGHCVAVDSAIPRRPDDLEPPRFRMGRVLPSSTTYLRTLEQSRIDDVSLRRERERGIELGEE